MCPGALPPDLARRVKRSRTRYCHGPHRLPPSGACAPALERCSTRRAERGTPYVARRPRVAALLGLMLALAAAGARSR